MALQTLNKEETVQQSRDAYRQWKDIWIANAKRNGIVNKQRGTDARDLMLAGRGRMAVLCAMGASLEKHLEAVKRVASNPLVDILCVDKCYDILCDAGIPVKYVTVSDASVVFSDWADKHAEQQKGTTLFLTATSNPDWSEKWAGPISVVICKDSIGTENEMAKHVHAAVTLPASSNVANGLVVIATHILGYQEISLVGFDYSWKPGEHYYAFAEEKSEDKRFWQMGGYQTGIDDEMCYTSPNLLFSARWLKNFYIGQIEQLGISMHNCGGWGICDGMPKGDLEAIAHLFKPKAPTGQQAKDDLLLARARTVRVTSEEGEEGLRKAFEDNVVLYADIYCVPKAVA
jgi:hypothetical protein